NRVAGQHELVAGVHCVECEVGHGHVHRHADADDRGDVEVAKDGIEAGARHRRQAVVAGHDEVALLHPDLRHHFGARRAGDHHVGTLAPLGTHEQPGVVVATSAVGAPVEYAVQHGNVRGAGG